MYSIGNNFFRKLRILYLCISFQRDGCFINTQPFFEETIKSRTVMKRNLIRLLSALALFTLATAQAEAQAVYQDDAVPKFDQEEFNGRFCVFADQAGESSYFVTDMTRLPDRFSKIYFLNLVYAEKMVVNIDPAVDKEQMWFKANIIFEEEDVACRMEDILEETLSAGEKMSGREKDEWLTRHDKFHQKNKQDESK